MAVTLYLVRHGETEDNALGIPQGLRDVPLNNRGRFQAEAVAGWFRSRDLTALISSPLLRTRDVARAIGAAKDIDVQEDIRLVEFDQGDLDGMPIPEARRRYPDFIERWRTEDPTDLRMPGGETYGEVQARMVEIIEEVAGKHPNGSVAMVTHNLAIKAALCHGFDVPLSVFRRIRIDLAAVSVVEVEPERRWRVSLMNERCHVDSV
tara:strand:- start:2536 stop:3156 length:621 start_codon:yes stop_codon:yes gene_type:complete